MKMLHWAILAPLAGFAASSLAPIDPAAVNNPAQQPIRLRPASIVISFEVDQRTVTIDGRDFLTTVFQLGKPTASRKILADN